MQPLRRPLVVAAVAAAIIIAISATLAARSSRRSSARHPSSAAAVAVEPAASASAPAGGGVSPSPSIDSARAAALAYLGLSERVVAMDVEAAVAAQREAATTAAEPTLVADLRRCLAALAAAYPAGGLHYRVGALAVRAEPAGPARARVEVFYVGVLSAPGVAPYEQWRLSRYDLVWERGGWKVAAESSGPGPRPAAPVGPEPASAAAMEATLAGFTSAVAP
jgi:hypothetical protein